MKISIGTDHRGLALKRSIIDHYPQHEFLDVGTFSQERVDYPLYAKKVCADVLAGTAQQGILICGSGVGMSIAANRHRKIYAALCWNTDVARCAKSHDNANILVLPADFVRDVDALSIVDVWLATTFLGDRYEQRLKMVDN